MSNSNVLLNPTLSNLPSRNDGQEQELQALLIFNRWYNLFAINYYLCLIQNHRNAFSIRNKQKKSFPIYICKKLHTHILLDLIRSI